MKSVPIDTCLIRFPDDAGDDVVSQARAAVAAADGLAEDRSKEIARRFDAAYVVQVPQPRGKGLVWETWRVSPEPSESAGIHHDDRLVFDSKSDSLDVSGKLKALFWEDERAPYDPEYAMRKIGFIE